MLGSVSQSDAPRFTLGRAVARHSLAASRVAPIVGARYTGSSADHRSPRAPRVLGAASRR
jgi:hypothetical protein